VVKTPTVGVLGRGSIVRCFLKLLNLAINMDHQSLDEFFLLERGAAQSFLPLMHWNLPLIGVPPLALLRIPPCEATSLVDSIQGEVDRVPRQRRSPCNGKRFATPLQGAVRPHCRPSCATGWLARALAAVEVIFHNPRCDRTTSEGGPSPGST
jgi:hypothetical protein